VWAIRQGQGRGLAYPCQVGSQRIVTPCIVSMFPFHGLLPVGTFAQRGLVASSLCRCGLPVPITRDAALPRPLFTLDEVLGVCNAILPQEPRFVARLVTCLSLNSSMLSWTPGCRFRARLYRAHRLACARMERIGTFPNLAGSRGYVSDSGLHPSPRCSRLSSFQLSAFSRYATERLTRPYSGGLTRLLRAPSQQATIARLPSSRQESPVATGRRLCSLFAACFRGGATISRPYHS
jgi:hypothetical protein